MKYNPIEWIEEFNFALRSTRCKVENENSSLEKGMNTAATVFLEIKSQNQAVWMVGNGGSCTICSHVSQDLLNKLRIRSSLLSDPSLLTCMANDYGYCNVYSKPLGILAQPGDLLIAISSSGKSKNILNCAKLAIKKNMKLLTLSGFDENNSLWSHPADISFHLPSHKFGLVEIGHEALLHAIVDMLCLVL